jgi:hypothetical protein
MSLFNYHLFVGSNDRGLMAPDANHFEIKLNSAVDFYRIAIVSERFQILLNS